MAPERSAALTRSVASSNTYYTTAMQAVQRPLPCSATFLGQPLLCLVGQACSNAGPFVRCAASLYLGLNPSSSCLSAHTGMPDLACMRMRQCYNPLANSESLAWVIAAALAVCHSVPGTMEVRHLRFKPGSRAGAAIGGCLQGVQRRN